MTLLGQLTDNHFPPQTLISTSLKEKKEKKEGIRVLCILKPQVPGTRVAFDYITQVHPPHPPWLLV